LLPLRTLHRIIGDVLLSVQRQGEAEVEFTRAIAIARQQQAKSWELRASMSLARLWRDQGNVQQARELLAPVYEWFTEGFDTRDLKEAKALLEELGS
jgi:predicted ATPase